MKPISRGASSLEWLLLLMLSDTGGLQWYPKAEGISEGSHIQHSTTKELNAIFFHGVYEYVV